MSEEFQAENGQEMSVEYQQDGTYEEHEGGKGDGGAGGGAGDSSHDERCNHVFSDFDAILLIIAKFYGF